MLDHAVHVLLVFILGRVIFADVQFTAELALLGMRTCLLLIAEETLQVVAQLRVDLGLVLLSLIRANEGEETVHFAIGLLREDALLLGIFLQNLILIFEIFLQALLVEVFAFRLDPVELRQLIKEIFLLLSLARMRRAIDGHFFTDLI
jgi:hypothetical protein